MLVICNCNSSFDIKNSAIDLFQIFNINIQIQIKRSTVCIMTMDPNAFVSTEVKGSTPLISYSTY